MTTYRVQMPIVGIEEAAEGMKVVRFKPGSLLKVANNRVERKYNERLGTVVAVFDRRIVNVFIQDLKEHAEQVH